MVANLYLHPDTFRYNGEDTTEQIALKFKMLMCDLRDIVYSGSDENKFFTTSSLATVQIGPSADDTLIEFAHKHLSGDEIAVFYSVIANVSSDIGSETLDEAQKKCIYKPDEEEVTALVVLNRPESDLDEEEKAKNEEERKKAHQSIVKNYIQFDEYRIVYNKNTWFYLRRQILGNHPGCPESFIDECRKYFPNLCFHSNCVEALCDEDFQYLDLVPRRIVYYLSCLNDKFFEFLEKWTLGSSSSSVNPNDILADFSGHFALDREGSIEMNPKKKADLTFNFENGNQSYTVLCEPHLKIDQIDDVINTSVSTERFNPRIYFCYDRPEVAGGKILVGSIGRHV